MPSVEQNRSKWDSYDWADRGSEWSALWGNAETQWHATVLPRIRRFLPANRVVEIGPGFGRWTTFLLDHAGSYVGVDLSERCVAECRTRFASRHEARFVLGDGRSLPGIEPGSVDLVFSFDSLVHAEADVLSSYVRALATVLTPSGAAFIHHSNLAMYPRQTRAQDRMSQTLRRTPRLRDLARARGLVEWTHWRGRSVSADLVAGMGQQAGLACIGQEVVPWGSRLLIDCISVLVRPDSPWDRVPVRLENPHFMDEARSAAAVAAVYP